MNLSQMYWIETIPKLQGIGALMFICGLIFSMLTWFVSSISTKESGLSLKAVKFWWFLGMFILGLLICILVPSQQSMDHIYGLNYWR